MNNTTTTATTRTRYTPADHAGHTLKPVKVLEVSTTGEHGPWGLIEFEGGFTRIIDLPTHKDANHPVFDSLEWADRGKLREAGARVVPMADGTVKVFQTFLSFASVTRNKRGIWKGDNCFDVPDEANNEGVLTGYKAARELLDAMRADIDIGGHTKVRDILKDAITALDLTSAKDPSRYWAASSFLRVVDGALRGAAKFTNFNAYIDELETSHVESQRRLDAHYAEQTAQRIAKGVATRKARAKTRKVAEVVHE